MSYQSSPIVLGYDASPASARVLFVAVDLTERLEGHLHVVHVVTLADYPVSPDQPGWESDAAARLRGQQAALQLQLSAAHIAWTYRTERGDPPEVLDRVAHQVGALMIVIGSRGHGVAARIARLASAAPSVSSGLRRLPTPILIVPNGTEDRPSAGPQDAPPPADRRT